MDTLVHCLLFALLGILAESIVIEQLSTLSATFCCIACSRKANCVGVVYGNIPSLCELQDTRDHFTMWYMNGHQNDWQRCTLVNDPVNLAQYYVNALQSSILGWVDLHHSVTPLGAGLAVDGNKNGDLSAESCSTTDGGDLSPWFRLDLNDTYRISRIVITNRQDCCANRLSDFKVTLDGVLCYHYAGEAAGDVELECNNGPMYGKTIEISKQTEYLTICEIEMF